MYRYPSQKAHPSHNPIRKESNLHLLSTTLNDFLSINVLIPSPKSTSFTIQFKKTVTYTCYSTHLRLSVNLCTDTLHQKNILHNLMQKDSNFHLLSTTLATFYQLIHLTEWHCVFCLRWEMSYVTCLCGNNTNPYS